jgi:methionyl-tRNA formyltransferase
MRIIFMGTPDFAVPSLRALCGADHEIITVYTQPPRRAGRGKVVQPSPVHRAALELGLCVRTPASLKTEDEQAVLASLRADVAVVAAYGLILPRAVLDAPAQGCINIHASLLPRWRGAAPVHRAILAGDTETGVTIMQMTAGLDTGPMLAKLALPIDRKTADALTAELASLGAGLIVKVIANLPAYPPIPQPEQGVTYATKIDKSEAQLDFMISAAQVERQIRAFHPAAFFQVEGERIRILAADCLSPEPYRAPPATTLDDALLIACNPGAIRPALIQRAGGTAMSAANFLRGFPIPAGTRLG